MRTFFVRTFYMESSYCCFGDLLKSVSTQEPVTAMFREDCVENIFHKVFADVYSNVPQIEDIKTVIFK